MKKLILLLIVSGFMFNAQSQYLAAFNDNVRHFWAFEAGMFNKLEHLEIQEYQVGGTLIAYLDNGSNLKVYSRGEVETLLTGSPIKFHATDYLLGYSMYEQLNVYDNGDVRVLSTQCDGYVVRDSIIGWHNRIAQNVQVYYDGQVFTIEDGLIYNPMESFKLGDNTLAYVQSSTKEFKLFYQGEVIVLDQFGQDMIFEAGRDIVAYIDLQDPTFKAFFKGEEYEVETFQPKSFQVGDEILGYVDNLGRLKFFDGYEVVELSSYEPEFYTVEDKVIVYEEQGFLKTYCNGQIYVIERYIPEPHRIDFSTIAYLDQSRFVKAFLPNCEPVTVSFEPVKEISLIRDLIIYVVGVNKTKIFFNGQVYEH